MEAQGGSVGAGGVSSSGNAGFSGMRRCVRVSLCQDRIGRRSIPERQGTLCRPGHQDLDFEVSVTLVLVCSWKAVWVWSSHDQSTIFVKFLYRDRKAP